MDRNTIDAVLNYIYQRKNNALYDAVNATSNEDTLFAVAKARAYADVADSVSELYARYIERLEEGGN